MKAGSARQKEIVESKLCLRDGDFSKEALLDRRRLLEGSSAREKGVVESKLC